MPEVQEVFSMATQKVRQDPGALDRQVGKQRRATRNRRIGVFATVLMLVAATVAAYAFSRGTRQGPASRPSTISIAPGAGPGTMVDLLTGKVTPLPASIATGGTYFAVSPDHTTVAYSWCCYAPNPLFTAKVDGTSIRQVSAPGRDVFAAQYSPDGSLLVYQQRNASINHLGDIFVQDTGSRGHRLKITNFDQSQRWGWWLTFPSFAPDGRSILYQLPRGKPGTEIWDLWSVPVAGGTPTLVRHNAGWGGYSPDGKWLAYLSPVNPSDFTGRTLWMTSVHGGTPRALVEGGLSWLRWSPDGTWISYSDGGSIHILNVATGADTAIAQGDHAEWFDDHTLIIGHPQ